MNLVDKKWLMIYLISFIFEQFLNLGYGYLTSVSNAQYYSKVPAGLALLLRTSGTYDEQHECFKWFFFMPIKSMVNGWQVGHWNLVKMWSRQILSCVVPAPQSGKLELKTICYSKDCAPLPWEPLNKPGMTEWLCAVLLFHRNAGIECVMV